MNSPYNLHVIEDFQLVERAKSGDAAAFGELVRKYQLDIRSFLRRRINDSATADDLAQEVFMGAIKNIGSLHKTSSVRSWLLSIARFKLIDFFRYESRQKTVNADVEVVLNNYSLENLDHDSLDAEVVNTLRLCIADLKPNAKQLLNEYYYADVAATDIAARMNQKSSTVRMNLLRIRRALAKCIRQKLGGDIEL